MIYVHEGTYVENVDVGKRITLIGDGADLVTVRAANSNDHVFDVGVDWVNISGFTVTRATYYVVGIRLFYVNRCSISENNASGNYRGIYRGIFKQQYAAEQHSKLEQQVRRPVG